MMTRIFVVILVMILNTVTYAQDIKSIFKEHMANTQTLTSNFKQTKNMKLLKDQIVSTGEFYYKKDNKVRVVYKKPYNYLVVLNNGQMAITDNFGKVTQMNTKNSKTLKAVNNIMVDCMSGNIFNNKDFETTATQNDKNYLVHLVPKTSEMKQLFSKIEVTFDKHSMHIMKMVMVETSGDMTTMEYFDTKMNTTINDQLFKVR